MDSPTATAPVPARPFEVTDRMVIGIAVPMTMAAVTTPVIGLTDAAVIGQLGDAALLGAVALGALMFDFLGTAFGFLRMGTTGLVAQAYGAGDVAEQRAVLWRALAIAAAVGLLLILLAGPMLALFLFVQGASEAVNVAARTYFEVRILGMPLMLANYAILGWLLGQALAGRALALQVVLAAANVVLSIAFVLGLGWGVFGVAAASVAAEAVPVLIGAGLVARRLGADLVPRRADVLVPAAFARMLAMNADIMVRSIVLMIGYIVFSAIGARSGDALLAGNAVLMHFVLVAAFFLDGLATAAEQLAGRAVGARWRPAFERAVHLSTRWGFGVAALVSAAIVVAGPTAIDLLTTSEEVRAEAHRYLGWAALAPLLGVLAFQMDGVYVGATWTSTMRNMMLLSFAAYLAVLWVAVPLMGNHGLWLALSVFFGARGLTLLARLPARADATFGRDGGAVRSGR